MERVKTGIPGMDNLLNGGLLDGRTMLLSGPCGSGKTIFAMQYVYNGVTKFNEAGLYVSLEEEKERIQEDMLKLGFDLKKIEKSGKFFLIGGRIAGLKDYMSKLGAATDDIIAEIEEVIKKNNIKRVVIDSINLFTMLLKDEEERRRALAKLSHRLSTLGCTSILTSETREGSMEISRYGIEEFVVDGVIVLYQVRQGDKFIPGIVVRKMRGSDHDKEIRLFRITNKGIIVYPKETMFTDI